MTAADIRAEIINILADIVPDEDTSHLDDQKPLREQIELDSMDFLDIVMELRKRYRIQIPEDDYIQLATLSSRVQNSGNDTTTALRALSMSDVPLAPRAATAHAIAMRWSPNEERRAPCNLLPA